MDANGHPDPSPAVASILARFERATAPWAQNRILRSALKLTTHGDKTALAAGLGRSYSWLMKKLQDLRGGADGNALRTARATKRSRAVMGIRKKLIKTTVGPHASSARRVSRIMKASNHPDAVKSRTCQHYVQHELEKGTCPAKPAPKPKDNEPEYFIRGLGGR